MSRNGTVTICWVMHCGREHIHEINPQFIHAIYEFDAA